MSNKVRIVIVRNVCRIHTAKRRTSGPIFSNSCVYLKNIRLLQVYGIRKLKVHILAYFHNVTFFFLMSPYSNFFFFFNLLLFYFLVENKPVQAPPHMTYVYTQARMKFNYILPDFGNLRGQSKFVERVNNEFYQYLSSS